MRNINCHKCHNFVLLCFYCYFIFYFCSLSYDFLAGKYFLHWYIFDGCQQTKPVKSEHFGIKSDIFLFSICGYIDMKICVITCLIKLFHFRLLGLWGGGKGNDLTPVMSSEGSTFFHRCLCWLLTTKLNTWNGLLPSYCSPKHVFFKLQVAI